MKNTLKKRTFISAIAMLIVSAIVLTSSTFAWFSMAKRVEVETMELNITSPDGVQLSGNANAFTTMLTLADLKGETSARWAAYEGNINNFPELLKPSSSTMSVLNSLPTFFAGSVDDASKLNVTQVEDDTKGGYVAFDVFVQVGKETNVYWNETTVSCEDNPDVLSAMRVAVVNCGPVAAKADADAILGVLPVNAAQHRVTMYQPNANLHTDSSGYADDAAGVPDYYFKAPCSGVNPGGNGKNITVSDTYTAAPNGIQLTDKNMDTEAYFTAVKGINRVRVYLWMEGNDVDCENSVAGATLGFNLVFTIK